jgi:uncharacterized protein (TIGR02118 family)
MIKVLALLKRKDGMALDDFSMYWEQRHGPLAVQRLPGLRKYVQNHALRLSKGEPPFDGVAEIWLDDLESWKDMVEFMASEEGKAIREDEERFLDRGKIVFLLVEEKVIKE